MRAEAHAHTRDDFWQRTTGAKSTRRKPGERDPEGFRISPFTWRPAAELPPRQWLYGRHLIRGFCSATFAAGGIGKSSMLIAEMLAMVSAKPLLGSAPVLPLRVALWAGEDPLDETERRIAAAMLHYQLGPEDVGDRLFVDSGRDQRLVIAEDTKHGATIAKPIVQAITREVLDNRIDVLVIDPFVSSHRVSENDNGAIDMVVKEWSTIAHKTGCAIELVHHVKKTGGAEVTVEDGRGASSLLAAVRSARVLNRMTDDEAARAGVENPFVYFRVGGNVSSAKANLTVPSPKATWFKMESVALGNGHGLYPEGDQVGVVTPWKWPDAMDGMTVADLLKAQKAVDAGRWRENVQAKDWVGVAIAKALDLDLDRPADKQRVKASIAAWLKSGALVTVTGVDDTRRPRTYVEVGSWANE